MCKSMEQLKNATLKGLGGEGMQINPWEKAEYPNFCLAEAVLVEIWAPGGHGVLGLPFPSVSGQSQP